jgi:hypothetical protein
MSLNELEIPLPTPLPVDLLNYKDLESLKISVKAQCLTGAEVLAESPNDLSQQWTEILATAACHDLRIQRMLVDESLSPGHYWHKALFDPLWVLGIKLPRSYSSTTSNTLDKIVTIVNSLTPDILRCTREKLDCCIHAIISESQDGPKITHRLASPTIPITSPTKSTIKLFQIIQQELAARRLDIETIEALDAVNELPGMPQSKEFLQYL